MDCNDAKEKLDLYVDDLLDDAEKQRLIWHVSSCPECKKAFDDAVRLKQALAGLKEVEPPAGLTASAVKKAKRHRIPIWAYASAAAAAAIALLIAVAPSMLPRTNSTADSEQKLMYSATGEEMAGDYDDSMMPEMEAGIEASSDAQTENMVGAGAPGVRTSGTDVSACTFMSEAEFAEAIRSEGVAYYYRPNLEALPEGAILVQIEVSDYSVRWVYSFGEDSYQTLVYEWYRTWTADDITSWEEQTMSLSDNLAHSFVHSGGVFWSTKGRFSESGEMEAMEGTEIHAYWTQGDVAFHAELPPTFAEQDILVYCVMEIVPLK